MSKDNQRKSLVELVDLALCWTGVIIWVLVIFHLSNHTGSQSGQLSIGLADRIKQVFEIVFPNITVNIADLNIFLRKSAHFFTYAVFATLIINVLNIKKMKSNKAMAITFIFCMFCSIANEAYQVFVPGRGGEFIDVIIQSAGAGTGILTSFVWSKKGNDIISSLPDIAELG